MHPLESVGDEPHEDAELEQEPDHSEVERIWQGMEPLEVRGCCIIAREEGPDEAETSVSSRLTLDVRVRVRLQRAIEQMQKEITGQQSEITRLEGVIHDLKRDHPHAAAPPPPGTTLRPICYAHGLY
eukprot:997726-Rhodomonas_salina.2